MKILATVDSRVAAPVKAVMELTGDGANVSVDALGMQPDRYDRLLPLVKQGGCSPDIW